MTSTGIDVWCVYRQTQTGVKQMTMKQRIDTRAFIRELETVSVELAIWAESKYQDGWSKEDIKIQIKNAMKICGKD